MKIITKINNDNNLLLNSDGILLYLKNLSISIGKTYDINEVLNIYKNTNKEIFLSINKNIFNDEIKELREVLHLLNNTTIKVLFYDLALLSIVKNDKLNIELVWSQEHFVTNYQEINFYHSQNVKYALISNEITYDEIEEISKNSKSKLLVYLICKPSIAVTKRKLVSFNNYQGRINNRLKTVNIKELDKDTIIYDDKIINQSNLLNINIDYGIIDPLYISDTEYKIIYDNIKEYLNTNNPSLLKTIENIIGNNTNFLYSPTIYKVKK